MVEFLELKESFFREIYTQYYERRIIRNLKKFRSVEFGTVGPRPTYSLLFREIYKRFNEGRGTVYLSVVFQREDPV